MNTDLHSKIDRQRALIFFLWLLLAGATLTITAHVVRIGRLQDVQTGMVNAAHQRHVEIEKLCEAVGNQEYIIRRKLPMVKMSWTAGLREICTQ